MNTSPFLSGAAAALLILAPAVSVAQTVTFEGLPLYEQRNTWVSEGFSFSGNGPEYIHLDGEKATNGTNYLIWGWGPSYVMTVNRVDNTWFDLVSLDLGNSYYTNSFGTVNLTASYGAGGSYTTTLSLTDSFQTFNLGLQGVSAVYISGVDDGAGVGYTAIDNFNTTTPVPEPSTYALLLAGLGLMGTIARRRKSTI
ncbi:MAG: PEP-CTERM sorting domain-containing protein [Pseudomonadota bacterium]